MKISGYCRDSWFWVQLIYFCIFNLLCSCLCFICYLGNPNRRSEYLEFYEKGLKCILMMWDMSSILVKKIGDKNPKYLKKILKYRENNWNRSKHKKKNLLENGQIFVWPTFPPIFPSRVIDYRYIHRDIGEIRQHLYTIYKSQNAGNFVLTIF